MGMQQKFYVYVDCTIEDGPRPFYVGMGNLQRTKSLNRNKKHTWVTELYGQQRAILFETSVYEHAVAREIELIKELDTFNPNIKDYSDIRCNRTRGGEGAPGYRFTNEQRCRQSVAIKKAVTADGVQDRRREKLRARYSNPTEHKKTSITVKLAYEENPEIRQRLSDSLKKLWSDPETRARRAEANRKIWDNPEAHENASAALKESYATNPERRKVVSESLKNFYQQHPDRCVQIEQRTLEGDLITTFVSLSEAVRQTRISNITACCKGRRSSAGGYVWKYVSVTCGDACASGSMNS